MNTNPTTVFARKLFHSPDILNGDLDGELVEQILRYAKGDLTNDDAAIIAGLIHDDLGVAACYQECQETLKLMQEAPVTRVPVGEFICAEVCGYLKTLGAAITDLFTFRATLATASGEEGLKRKLADGQTQITVHSDSAGRLWLRVTSTAQEFRNGSFKLDIEPAASVLIFTEVEPGLYSARVCVTDEVAAALGKGAIPKLTPLPPNES